MRLMTLCPPTFSSTREPSSSHSLRACVMFPMRRAERPILSVCVEEIFELLRSKEKSTKKIEEPKVNDGSMTVCIADKPPPFPSHHSSPPGSAFDPYSRFLMGIEGNVKFLDAFEDTQ